MPLHELKIYLKRLYDEYVRFHLKRIFLCLFLSILVAGTSSSIAWLLDPAVKKIFIEKDQLLAWLIPLAIIITFSVKGLSLYFARLNISIVGQTIAGDLQKKVGESILFSDIQTLDSRHSGRYISNIMYDSGQVSQLVSVGVLNIMKDSFSVIFLVGLMFYQNWKLAFFAIFMIPLAGGLAKNLGKKVGKATTQASLLSGNLTSYLTDIFRASKMIRIFQKEDNENNKVKNYISALVNKNIRKVLSDLCIEENFIPVFPPLELCGDNAAMIAMVGLEKFKLNQFSNLDHPAKPRWPLDESAAFLKGAGVQL
mgnify:CR=1 FL=1